MNRAIAFAILMVSSLNVAIATTGTWEVMQEELHSTISIDNFPRVSHTTYPAVASCGIPVLPKSGVSVMPGLSRLTLASTRIFGKKHGDVLRFLVPQVRQLSAGCATACRFSNPKTSELLSIVVWAFYRVSV
jgi:hypothetical protein